MEECVSCHGNHAVQPASLELFDRVCANCHDPTSGAYRRGQGIKAMLVEAAGAIEDAREQVLLALKMGLDVRPYEQSLDEAETNLIQSGPETHALDMDLVERHARAAMAVADDVKLELHHRIEEILTRRYFLVILWAFILVVVPTIFLVKLRVRRRMEAEGS
jgi:hypothetical protein